MNGFKKWRALNYKYSTGVENFHEVIRSIAHVSMLYISLNVAYNGITKINTLLNKIEL